MLLASAPPPSVRQDHTTSTRSGQSALGDYLDRLLARRGLTLAGFADILGSTVAEVERIKAIYLPVRLHRPWMRVLQLTPDEENAFVYLAWSQDPEEQAAAWSRLAASAGGFLPPRQPRPSADPVRELAEAAAAALTDEELIRGL